MLMEARTVNIHSCHLYSVGFGNQKPYYLKEHEMLLAAKPSIQPLRMIE